MTILETLVGLVDIPSVTGDEGAIADAIEARSTQVADVTRVGNSLVASRRSGRPLLLLVGHIDTVPHQGQPAAFVQDGKLYGLGTSDMKAGVAVMQHLLEDPAVAAGPYDVAYVFYGAEEGPAEANELEPLIRSESWLSDAELGIVMEPTNLELQLGCNGMQNAMVTFSGKSAHSARPWMGHNAVTKAGRWLWELHEREPEDFVIDGLLFREVFSVTRASGGVANNIIPPTFDLLLNHRFPPLFSLEEAADRLRSVAGDADVVEILDAAPAGPVPSGNVHLARLSRITGAAQTAKQGWTDVARLAMFGVPAFNYGPGDDAQAHQVGEYAEINNLEVCFDALKEFLTT